MIWIKSRNDFQAANRQEIQLTFLNPTEDRNISKSCLDLEKFMFIKKFFPSQNVKKSR